MVIKCQINIAVARAEIRRRLLKKFKKKCCVCGNKSDLFLCYNTSMACNNCKRFFNDMRKAAESGKFRRPPCVGNGKIR